MVALPPHVNHFIQNSSGNGEVEFVFTVDLPYRENPPTLGFGLNYDPTVFDPRGRRVYGRVLWAFE